MKDRQIPKKKYLIDYITKLYEIDIQFRSKSNELKAGYQGALAQLELIQENLYNTYVQALNEYVNFTDNVYPKNLQEITKHYTTAQMKLDDNRHEMINSQIIQYIKKMNNIDRMTNNVLDFFKFKDKLPSTSTSLYKDIININNRQINNNNLFKQDVDYLKRYNQAFKDVLNITKHNDSKESLENIIRTNISNNQNNYQNNNNNMNLFNASDNLDDFKDLFYKYNKSNKSNTSLNKF